MYFVYCLLPDIYITENEINCVIGDAIDNTSNVQS